MEEAGMRVDWESGAPFAARAPGLPDEGAGLEAWAAARGLEGLCFFQTSGSEGRPKWVGLHRRAFLASARAVNAHFESDARDVWLLALPLHHVGGFAILARAHLSGATVLRLEGKWQPRLFAEACARATLASVVPAQVHDLVREKLRCPAGVRAVIVGGGGMTPALAAAALELGWPVCQSYGMTEAASQVATQPWTARGPAGSVEKLAVLPHWQVEVDDEARLRLRGPALAAGYAVAAAEGGWQWLPLDAGAGLLTRDRARLWREGGRQWLTFLGRESGFVKILGELAHLDALQARVETLALQFGWPVPPVLAPRPDARAETALVLVCERGCPPPEPLLAAFHAASPPWLRLAGVRVLDALPRTPLGKVRQEELRRLLEAG